MKRAVFAVLCAAGLALSASAQAAELKVGDDAPNFKLKATDGKTYNLADFKGKQAVVLAWFPAAFTAGCTIECKSLAEHGDLIKKYDVTYFMASVDKLEATEGKEKSGNIAFAQEHKADFPILGDPTKEVATAYGVLSPRGVANRWTFYIGKDGKISYIDKDVQSHVATSAEDMAAKLGELKVAKK
jgi:peroxiredoxin Q/BCP